MTNGPIRRGIWRQFVLWTLTGALLLASAGFDRSAWAQSSEEPSIEDIKKSLDEIESAVDSEDITGETLAGFRDKLNSATDILRKNRLARAARPRGRGPPEGARARAGQGCAGRKRGDCQPTRGAHVAIQRCRR